MWGERKSKSAEPSSRTSVVGARPVRPAVESMDFLEHRELAKKLLSAVQRSKGAGMTRLLTQTSKMLYLKWIRMAHKTFEIEVPTFWGEKMAVILPEVVSTSIWRYGYFEDEVCLFMLRQLQEGMTFIDIGAHFGFFTLLGARLVGPRGQVLSIEPVPYTFQQLQKNTHGHFNVRAYNVAAFDRSTEIDLYDFGLEGCAYNSVYGLRTKKGDFTSDRRIVARAMKVDDLIHEKKYDDVNLIKIDAESSEMHVLNGLVKTLKTYKPHVIIEVGDFGIQGAERSSTIVEWLQEKGYSPYGVENGAILKHKKKEWYEYGNILFVPEK